MQYNRVELGPGYFPLVATANPVALGLIYVGEVDLDPTVVANQKTLKVQQEDGTIISVAQPISLSAGGVPLYSGAPVVLLVEGNYAIAVLDVSGAQVYYNPKGQYLDNYVGENFYYPDPTEADQGNATGGDTTVKDIIDALTTPDIPATIVLRRTSGSDEDDYIFLTSEIIPKHITIVFEHGARIKVGAGATVLISSVLDIGPVQIFDVSSGGQVIFAYARNVRPEWWQDNSVPGATDMVAAFEAAFSSLPSSCNVIFSSRYALKSAVAVNAPAYTTVTAYGAVITFTTDASGFNFKPSETASLTGFKWFGGFIWNSAEAKTISTAMEFVEAINVEVANVNFNGFYRAIYFTDRREFHFHNNIFVNSLCGIYGDNASGPSAADSTAVCINNNSFILTGTDIGIDLEDVFNNVTINNNTFIGLTSNYHIKIANTSADIYGYNITSNHFLGGDATTTYIFFDSNNSKAFISLNLTSNVFKETTSDAVVLEHCVNVSFIGNLFAQTTGTPINLDVDCESIVISKSNFFAIGTIVYACERNEITYGDAYVSLDFIALTGYAGEAHSDSTGSIDMSSVFANFPTIGLPPKAYDLSIWMRDSGSSGDLAYIELAGVNAFTAAYKRVRFDLSGRADDLLANACVHVPADANGDLNSFYEATGALTLDVWINVTGYYM